MRDPSQIEQHVVLDRVFAEILKPTLEVLNSGVTPGEIREGWQLVVMRENSQDLYTFNGHTHLNREATSADALDKDWYPVRASHRRYDRAPY
jgi:isocitrate/isopropylmalate dehydrogenase